MWPVSSPSPDSNTVTELKSKLRALQRTLEIRGAELEDAHRHIAALEEQLLKLKGFRHELKLLKEQKQTLRRSPERRIGQILLAPYRLPEKLVKKVWKNFHREKQTRAGMRVTTEYQKWFEQHHASADDLKGMRNEARAFTSRPLISVIMPVFNTPVSRLQEAVESVLTQAYDDWEILLVDDGSTDPDLLCFLTGVGARDTRITVAALEKHGGIAAG